ncbi:MAG: ABC transporter permease [Acidobacteria bacterium]|nr:MAG: ABC transporter permease [Acidobacteriota bacterium]
MLHECRAALRATIRRPLFAAIVVALLALGIGANSAIFSAVDAVLLRPLPYPAADRLVAIYEANVSQHDLTSLVAPVRLEEWNRMNRSLEGLAGSYFENMTDTSGPLPERVAAMRISPRFFSVLGTPAALGRTPAPEEDRLGGPAVVVVSDAFWRERLNGDPTVVGGSRTLGGVSRTIVGVMPASFRYPSTTTEAWIPAQMSAGLMQARQARFYTAVGRLKPGVTPEQAEADLSTVQAQLGEQFPQTDKGWTARAIPLKEEKIGGVRRSLWLLFGAVTLLLLAACGNVACLMLADATRREREVAVRFALGASRRAIVRQLFIEGLVLALAGVLGGLVLARWATDLLANAATQLPRANEVRMDVRLLAFTLAIGIATTVLFSLAPALQATRHEIATRLARSGRGLAGGRLLLQRFLVGAQVTLAILLLVGAGLLVRSFARLQQVSLGFDPHHVLTFRISAQWSERPEAVAARQLRTLQRLQAIPGVVSASFSGILPAGADFPPAEFKIVGRDLEEHRFATARQVSADYFHTMRIPLLQGESCRDDLAMATAATTPGAPVESKILVTRAFADRFFPNDNPIGHRVIQRYPGVIIGVVGDVRENGVYNEAPPILYYCGLAAYWPDPFYEVRIDAASTVSMTAIREAVHSIEPGRAVYAARTLDEALSDSLSQPRLNTILLTLFATTALALAAIGLYGVLSQLVAARRREIGVRMALGARPAQIFSSIASQAAAITGAGLVLGIAGALALSRIMGTLVFDVTAHDPFTFALAPIVLAVVAAAATIVPARRAARVDPIHALRED